MFLSAASAPLRANVPGAIVSGGSNVTLTNNGNGTVTMANGIVSLLFTTSNATITQINYTYNNGSGTKTTQLLSGGYDGGELYWEYGGFGGNPCTYSVVVNPATGDTTHGAGNYAEIDLLSSSSTNGTVDMHFSMLRGSPGFYVTAVWNHRAADAAMAMGETRTNIYVGSAFNWMTVDAARNKLMDVAAGDSGVAVYGAPQECVLWADGIYQGLYEDKYKYSATFGREQYGAAPPLHRVWGWSSVGTGGLNVGLWDVTASAEYYNGGPMKRELMCHHTQTNTTYDTYTTGGSTILNMFNGGHYDGNQDANYAAGEVWSKVYGPYFVYCNNVSTSTTNAYAASQALYNDALAQGTAEASGTPSTSGSAEGATAWPYGWFVNPLYAPASGRGTVNGNIVISDSGNPNASAANLWVGLVQQPQTSVGQYDFQSWMKPYQFWTQTDANGNFTIPNVLSAANGTPGATGSNYTLYVFGPGAEGELMSQNQIGGDPPLLYDLPATQFGVAVASGSTTNLGTVMWTPARLGATVFEIGYPDRTSGKFRHGDDYWVGDIGASPQAPAPVWNKFLEFPFDYPGGLTYTIGKSRWSTDWNYVQPVVTDTFGNYDGSSSTINFSLPSAPANGAQASIYMGLASAYTGLTSVIVNGTNLVGYASATLTPEGEYATSGGFYPANDDNDTTVREGNEAIFADERLTFPGTMLKAGTNTITVTMGQGGYFANHIMYDYLRLELQGYVPPPPANAIAYPANNSNLVCWPVTPGSTSYDILRSTTSDSNYSVLATRVPGPVCGSGPENATYLDTTASNGTTYYYVVQSANTTGTSANSAQSSGAIPSASISGALPAAPGSPTATAGNAEVTLNWSASSGADYYMVQRSDLFNNGGGAYNTLSTITLTNTDTGTSYTDTSPTNGSTYSYTILAVNAAGTSSASTAVNAVPTSSAPMAAPVLTAQSAPGQVNLTWAAVPGATGYVISVSGTHGGPYTLIGTITELTYPYTGLPNNTSYYFVVAATNFGGTSANSNEASATTPPASPTNLRATGTTGQIILNWAASTGAISYNVYRGTTSGGPYSAIATGVSAISSTDASVLNGQTYYYVVAAVSTGGTSAYSNEASASPVPAPGTTLTLLTWDHLGASPADPADGAGNWDTVSTLWSTGTADVVWNNADYYGAIFGNANGAAGTITVGAISAGALLFNAPGSGAYTLTSGTVALSGSQPAITANVNATIGALLSCTNSVTMNGSGTLTLTAPAAFAGPVNLANITLYLSGPSGSAMLGSGTLSLANATVVNVTGSNPTSLTGVVDNPVFVGAGQNGTFQFSSRSQLNASAMTGSGTLNILVPGSIGGAFRSDCYAHFDQFSGTVDFIGKAAGGGARFFLLNGGADGSSAAQWTIGGTGSTNVTIAPVTDTGGDAIDFGSLSGGANGNLSGGASTTGGSSGPVTYVVGALGLNTNFAGAISGNAAFDKVGAGTQILSGSASYTGATEVDAGILEITGTITGTSSVTVGGSAVFYLAGGSLSVSGSITNNGIFKLSGTTALNLTGSFINNGVLDLINASSGMPPSLVNNGAVLQPGTATVLNAAFVENAFSLSVQSYPQHTYQLQRSTSLANPSWTNIGSSQAGTGSALDFTDSGATGASGFYRVLISP